MKSFAIHTSLLALILLLLPLAAYAIVEPGTKLEFDDTVIIEGPDASHSLKVTGVGLREKTFMKVNVYSIVSYMAEGVVLRGEPGQALLELDAPKMIRMDLLRSFSREKLVGAFKDVIEKNYKDRSAFAADMDTFFAYFTDEAKEGDELIFTYLPGVGLKTVLNGQEEGVIANFAFVKALWTVWFGEKPADGNLKKNLLAEIAS